MTAHWAKTYFGDLYAEIYSRWLIPAERTNREATFVRKVLKLTKQTHLLDVAAGYGRHAARLSRHCRVVALDNSPLYMQLARQAQRTNAYDCVTGDMRFLPFAPASFDALILLFSSFGYFGADEKSDANLLMLADYARVLKPGGQLLLEVPNPPVLREAVADNPRSTMTNGKFEIEEEFAFLENGNVLANRTVFRDKTREQSANYQLRLYEKSTVQTALRRCGFKVLTTYGDYDGSPFDRHDSDVLLLHCVRTKKAALHEQPLSTSGANRSPQPKFRSAAAQLPLSPEAPLCRPFTNICNWSAPRCLNKSDTEVSHSEIRCVRHECWMCIEGAYDGQ